MFVSVSLVCCSQKEHKNISILSVDSTLVGHRSEVSNGIFLHFPKDFVVLEEYKSLLSDNMDVNQSLIEVAGNIDRNHFCFITKLSQEYTDSAIIEELIKDIPDSNFKHGIFSNNGIAFNQVAINHESRIIFSLWHRVEGDAIIKYDYILSLPVTEIEIKAVESSIGTITKIK